MSATATLRIGRVSQTARPANNAAHIERYARRVFPPAFASTLLDWGDSVRRDLPWRRTRDPWAVMVSELMLQQTQVARVVPKFEAFVRAYESPTDCASAPLADVIAAWAGLGYNRRAVNLHRAAVEIRDRHSGQVPSTIAELLALPGIGPYTARAVLAFAFERDVGVVDVNVGRLLARWSGHAFALREAQATADSLVPVGSGWRWNQTLFDLGATVCTARAPSCGECPVSDWCTWRGAGEDPATGSAAISARQPRFEGSDRQGRGRLVNALRDRPIARGDAARVMGWPDDASRAERVAASLVVDGLVVVDEDGYSLPR